MKNNSTRMSAYAGTNGFAIPTDIELYDMVNDIVDYIERLDWKYFTREDFEDMRHDAYIKVRDRLSGYDPTRGRFRTWAYRVVFNLACDAYKQLLKRLNLFSPLVLEDEDGEDFDSHEAELSRSDEFRADDAAETQYYLETIEGAIDNLPSRMREVVNYMVDGYKRRDVAKILGISPNAVGMLYNRGRKVLRGALTDILNAA